MQFTYTIAMDLWIPCPHICSFACNAEYGYLEDLTTDCPFSHYRVATLYLCCEVVASVYLC